MTPPVVRGDADAAFGRVADAFRRVVAAHREGGAALCLYRHGRPVVDMWAGHADPQTGRPWRRDTPVLVFSATKAATVVCVLRLVEEGRLDLDAPVAGYWPEFAAAGKRAVPLRWVLTHQAGLAAVDAALTLEQVLGWEDVIAAIARQHPQWTPGTAIGYHPRSFGWILGELVRRTTGTTVGRYLHDTVVAPRGLEFWIGGTRPAKREPASLIPPPPAEQVADTANPGSLAGRALFGPNGLFAYDRRWNDPDLLRAELPSSNGVATARGLAGLYDAIITPSATSPALLRPDTLAAATGTHAEGPDIVLGRPARFGLGFLLQPYVAPGAGPRTFGHGGAGGSLGFADPESGFAFGYVTNRMRFFAGDDPRTTELIHAVYAAAA
ncbi:serine hydrolase domain-containing protein [Dactylosporangium sucinum]|uniref:Esterase n=1 Tax=Dactylosporangium sucinum TaxID=1424081 RepID=A0A917WVJ9_9ACTN|nr:serine hydrolase domain-containing protein [Dactylosporangium sucinum]GGM36413.1 esterase [Dactylosporangium sucinum]